MLTAEKRADNTLADLLHQYPNSPLILRFYGSYVLHMKDDSAQAETCFNKADSLEEQKMRSKTAKYLKRRPSVFSVGAFSLSAQSQQSIVGTSSVALRCSCVYVVSTKVRWLHTAAQTAV